VARRSIWTRAKHRVGLERPHFVATEPWRSLQSKKTFHPMFCPRASPDSERNRRRKKVNRVKTVRITYCTFRIANFFTLPLAYGIRSKRFAATAYAKVTAQKRSNRAGGPHFFADDPPKSFVGSLPPSQTNARRCFARLHMSTQGLSDRMSDIFVGT